MKVGVGLANGQGSDPQLMFRYSKDGGKTWSNEKQTSFGKIGEYSKRVRFRSLGQFRRFQVELSTSDPVEVKFEGPLIVPK
jgi:Neuraminidase (sialidase)